MGINQANPQMYSRIMQGITNQTQLSLFQGAMNGVDGISQREAKIKLTIKELEKTNKRELLRERYSKEEL